MVQESGLHGGLVALVRPIRDVETPSGTGRRRGSIGVKQEASAIMFMTIQESIHYS